MAAKDVLGRRGEDLAVDYLTARGYRLIERNWRCRDGEIDIVADDAGETVFVEVKTRSGTGFGHPFEAITPEKLSRMRRLAFAWTDEHGMPRSMRLDAVAVIAPPNAEPSIEHLRGLS